MASEPHTLQPRTNTRYSYRWHSVAFIATMCALALVALAATILSSRASSSPLLDEETMSASRELATTRLPANIPLASAGDLQIMLPVFEEELTAIGYHPVNGENVISLKPLGTRINGSIFEKGLGQVITGGDGPGYIIMHDGNEFGASTISMDVGAPSGTVVYSPVDGTVAGVRTYDLKGVCPDTEIRIQPQNQSNLVVVMTHINHSEASLGQPVRSGVTRLGSVRKMDACYEQQLASYTYDDGNHLHMQVERLAFKSRP